jgi:molybdate transport repressor ModE-like protein
MTAALILAAGKAARRGEFEPEKELGTISAIQRIAIVLQRAGVERVAVVCEEDAGQVEKLTAHMNLVFLHGHKNDALLDNVKLGLTYLQDKCSAVLVARVDVPLFSVETVRQLAGREDAFRVPACHGRAGHPLLLPVQYVPSILAYGGEGGLADAVAASGLPVQAVPVEDEGILADVQDAETCSQLLAEHDLTELHFDLRLRLMKERAFYGPGTHQLLQLTEETGSLLDACRLMGISYSKGRKLISKTEQQMGYPVIESQQGGKTGGRSVVTDQGKALIAAYNDFTAEAKECLARLFDKYFAP